MTGIENYGLYFVSAFILTMTPGLDTVMVLNRSIAEGRRAGLLSALGVSLGLVAHTALAAFGLSMLLAQSELAFSVMKYCGAAYLCYLGFTTLLASRGQGEPLAASLKVDKAARPAARGNGYYFLSALATNLLNPKVVLFFLAFFPQFISPGHMDDPVPYFVLGLTNAMQTVIWFTGLSLGASLLAGRLLHSRAFKRWMDRCSGAVFFLMGVKLAFTER